jgi:Protein of unknown function (DUF2914)
MNKVLIGCMLFTLFLIAGVVLAQQTPTAAPAPAAPAVPAAPGAPASPAKTPATRAPAASLTISRLEIAGSIENREPVDIAASFPSTQEKVYCYIEFKDVPQDTTITYVWTLGQNDMGKVTQQVKKSSRWRTWANKSLGGMKGDWKVDVLDESGAVLKSATFKVE